MKIAFAITTFFLFPVWAEAQAFQIDKPPLPIDSLKKVLPFLKDSARVDCLNELARSYTEGATPRPFDFIWALVKQAHTEASEINYIKGLGDACFRYGHLSQWWLWNSLEMEKYYREAIFWYKKIQHDEGLGHAFMGLGGAFLNQGAPDESKEAFEQSAFHFRKSGNRVMLADLTDRLGYVYNAKGDVEKYFESIKRGLQEKKRIGDNRGMIWSFYRLAYIYQSVGDFEAALEYFRQSYRQAYSQSVHWHIDRSMGDVFLHLKNYDSSLYYYHKNFERLPAHGPSLAGLGKLFLLQKHYDTALTYLQRAILSFEKRNDDGGIMWALADMGKSYIGLKQYSKALQCARESLTIAKRWDVQDVIQHAYEIHWNVYETLRQKDSAYFYFKKFVGLKDSLDYAKYKRQYLQKLMLYKVEIKEEQQQVQIDLLNKENQIKQQQLQKEALNKKLLIGSLAALVLFSVIVFTNISLKRKNEKHRRELAENELQIQKLESERTKAELQQQATQLKMQALQAQMNPHFIFNALNCINRFILKKQNSDAAAYLTKFSRLVRMILYSSESATVNLAEDLEALQLYLELESLRFGNKFRYQIQCDPEIDPGFIQVPPMLIQPYVENAIWHGLLLKEGEKQVWLNIGLEDTTLVCTITDNGIGRAKAAEKKGGSPVAHKSMGMRITADRIALLDQCNQVKASIQIKDLVLSNGNAGGTEVTLKIPLGYD